MAVNGKHAESNFVLARYKSQDTNGDLFWIVGIDRDVVQIEALAAGVDHSERREARLQSLAEPELDLGR